jgi:predicted amidohydrolase YtcJ
MSSTLYRVGLVAFLVGIAACGGSGGEGADLVLRGGKIVTVDDANTEVSALAARDGRIVALGSDADVASFIGSNTQVIDLDGALAIPGLIEGHAHYMGVGRSTLQLNLMDVANWDEAVDMVAAAVATAEEGVLITGRGWHQEKWDARPEQNVDGLPYHDALSAVSPDNPVILTHASGHATFANARAMELSGITADTEDPDGGEIVRDPDGNPIGAFRETASGLLRPARANSIEPDPRRVALLAQEESFAKGITSFQDAGSSWGNIDLWTSMIDGGELDIRIYAMIRENPQSLAENLDAYRVVGYGDNRLTVRAIKVAIDGALGSHGAWLLEPYADLPSSAGLNTTPMEDVIETARLAMEHDYQYNVHAIGDRGNRETLDIFEAAYEAAGEGDYRWRVEHAQHLHPDDIPRFGALGVIPAMQGVHATSDGPWLEAKLGLQRAEEGAYVWQSLMKTGAIIVNGTDAPVEDLDPIPSYYASVSRRMANDEVLFPEQRMSRMEALRSYTINAAYGAFEEDLKGSLEVGKLADITVLSQDILTIDEELIPETEVRYTIVGGKVVYTGGGR